MRVALATLMVIHMQPIFNQGWEEVGAAHFSPDLHSSLGVYVN